MVFGEVDRVAVFEDLFHDSCVACDFLLVAGCKSVNVEICQELFDLPVTQGDALDPGRRTDAFYCCYSAKR